MRLRVVLTAHIADVTSFLNSLLRDHPGYRLTLQWEDADDAPAMAVDLTGPGPEDSCREVIEAIRADARVGSVEVKREHVTTWQPRPDGALFIYPKDGASYTQQARDRYQCDISAVMQTGFDPTMENGGVPPESAPAKQLAYLRAEAACLEARGYEVR
jgi:hypothetical protein